MSILTSLFGNRTSPNSIKVLEKDDFKNAITNTKVQLVDVRTHREYTLGHIKGARNLDYFQQSKFVKGLSEMRKGEPIYLYCQSGNRSRKAVKRLVSMGFTMIYDLKGGYSTWNYKL